MTKNCNSKSSFQDYQEGTAHCHCHGTSPFHSGSVTLFLICKCADKSHKEMSARCRRENTPPKTDSIPSPHQRLPCTSHSISNQSAPYHSQIAPYSNSELGLSTPDGDVLLYVTVYGCTNECLMLRSHTTHWPDPKPVGCLVLQN